MGADRHNGILTSLLLLVAETINRIQKTVSKNNSKKFKKKEKQPSQTDISDFKLECAKKHG